MQQVLDRKTKAKDKELKTTRAQGKLIHYFDVPSYSSSCQKEVKDPHRLLSLENSARIQTEVFQKIFLRAEKPGK
jgi:hypothetical protein